MPPALCSSEPPVSLCLLTLPTTSTRAGLASYKFAAALTDWQSINIPHCTLLWSCCPSWPSLKAVFLLAKSELLEGSVPPLTMPLS